VLVSIEEYRKLRGEDTGQSLLDRLSMDEDIDFEPTRLRFVPKEAEL
jgi:hypothetical protein